MWDCPNTVYNSSEFRSDRGYTFFIFVVVRWWGPFPDQIFRGALLVVSIKLRKSLCSDEGLGRNRAVDLK
jgi:hypothetical protein